MGGGGRASADHHRPKVTNGRIERLAFRQQDPVAARGLTWSQGLKVTLGYADGSRTLTCIGRPARRVAVTAAGCRRRSSCCRPGTASAMAASSSTRAHAASCSRTSRSTAVRRAAPPWSRSGRRCSTAASPPRALAELLRDGRRAREGRAEAARMLGYSSSVTGASSSRTSAGGDRTAPGLDAARRAGRGETASLKSAWFNALRDTAHDASDAGVARAVWRKTEAVPGLVLAEPDFITLAQELAVRGVADGEAILDEQIARTQNPDRKARMIFVRPSLSARSLDARRVLRPAEGSGRTAPRSLGARRARLSAPPPSRRCVREQYVLPSLDMLREIQQTGDIFFPKRWMDATLSGHRSRRSRRSPPFLGSCRPLSGSPAAHHPVRRADDLLRMYAPRSLSRQRARP